MFPLASTLVSPNPPGEFSTLISALLNSEEVYRVQKPRPILPIYFLEAMWSLHAEGKYITNPRLIELTGCGGAYVREITHKGIQRGILEKTEDSIRGHITKHFLTQYGKNYIKNYLGV